MKFSISNWLGPLSTTYRFEDGSSIHRSSRESVTYRNGDTIVHVDFYHGGKNGYRYVVPKNLGEVSAKMQRYCRLKHYKIDPDFSPSGNS